MYKIKIEQVSILLWSWVLVGANGVIICRSQKSFYGKAYCVKSAVRFRTNMLDLNIGNDIRIE